MRQMFNTKTHTHTRTFRVCAFWQSATSFIFDTNMPAGRTAHCVDCFCIRVLCVFVSMFFFCVCSGCGFSLHSRAFYVNIGNNSPHIQTSVFTVFAILPPRICGGKTQTNRPNSIIILLFSQKTMHMVHNRIKCARAFSPNCHGHRRHQPKRQCDRVVATPPPPLTPLRVAADPPVVAGHGRAIAEISYANRVTCIYTTLKRTPVCVCGTVGVLFEYCNVSHWFGRAGHA